MLGGTQKSRRPRQKNDVISHEPQPRHSGLDPESRSAPSVRHSGLDPESRATPTVRHSGLDPESRATPTVRHSGLDPESRGFLPTVLDSGPGSESGVTFFRRNDKLTLIASQGK
jgi:hypothetical protein